MGQAELHLVDANGHHIPRVVQDKVETAFRWVVREFPLVDTALISDWAEDVGKLMNARWELINSPQRYAYSALKGRVHDWMKTCSGREEPAGIGRDLEVLGGAGKSFQGDVERKILFDQLKAALSDRDRYILVLLLRDTTGPAVVAEALNISYPAAAKAIQRVKERLAAAMGRSTESATDGRTPKLCVTKG